MQNSGTIKTPIYICIYKLNYIYIYIYVHAENESLQNDKSINRELIAAPLRKNKTLSLFFPHIDVWGFCF